MQPTLTDLIAPNLKVIFCGINPGLKSALDGHHFSGRSNRFWRVLHHAGFTPYEIKPQNDATILDFGYGLTTAVARATVRADELLKDEFANSIETFKEKMEESLNQNILHSSGNLPTWLFQAKNKSLGDLNPQTFVAYLFGYYLIRAV
jgi:mismatch-specific thymine-DNA glycosylase